MKTTVLAILAVALAALAPFALAAEGDGDKDDGGVDQPTMRQLANKIDSAVRRLGAVETTVATLSTATAVDALTTEVRTLSSTVSANHTTIVGKFAPQMAVVMAVPAGAFPTGRNSEDIGYASPNSLRLYLVGDSTILGFPTGTVATNGQFTDTTLPVGTYLFELQQPHSDSVICHDSVSRPFVRMSGARRNAVCPRLRLHPVGTTTNISTRHEEGSGVYTHAAPTAFRLNLKFPSGLTFPDDKPVGSYSGAVRITKLK